MWLAVCAVAFATLINIISMTRLHAILFPDIQSWANFNKLYDAKDVCFFLPYLVSASVYELSSHVSGEVRYGSDGIRLPQSIFPLGGLTYSQLTILLTDILFGFLQWYWIGRLILWARRRIHRARGGGN